MSCPTTGRPRSAPPIGRCSRPAMPPNEIGRMVIGGDGLGGDLNVGPAISPDGRWIAFLSDAQPVLDRSLRRRRGHRQGRAQADEHRQRPALLEPAVHLLGRRVGRRQPAHRDRHRHLRPPRARDLRRAERATRSARSRSRRSTRSSTRPGRPTAARSCFTGMSARPHRSVRLRSRGVEAAAADQRRVRRSAAGVVAGRHGASPSRPIASRAISRRSPSASYRLALIDPASGAIEQVRVVHQRQEHQPAMDARQPRAVVHLGPRRHPEPLPRGDRHGRRTLDADHQRRAPASAASPASSPALSVASRSGTAAFSRVRQTASTTSTSPSAGDAPVGRAPVRSRRPIGGRAAAARPAAERRAGAAREPDPRAAAGHGDYASERAVQVDAVARSGRQPTSASASAGSARRSAAASAFQFGDMLGNHIADHRRAAQFRAEQQLQPEEHRGAGALLQPGPPLELGHRRRPGAVPERRLPERARTRSAANRRRSIRRSSSARPSRAPAASSPIRSTARSASSSRAASRRSRSIRSSRRSAFSLSDRPADRDRTRTRRRSAQPLTLGDHVGGAGVRHVDLRRDQPGAGTALSARGLADLRLAAVTRACWPTTAATSCRRRSTPSPTRVMHYGRYGARRRRRAAVPAVPRLSESRARLRRRTRSTAADCLPTAASDCPAFDRLMGSRMLVGNLEFRFPLLRPFGASQGMYGPLPVEVALFADGGVAWNRGEKPSFLGGDAGRRRQRRRRASRQPPRLRGRRVRLRRARSSGSGAGLGVPVQSRAGVLTPRIRVELGELVSFIHQFTNLPTHPLCCILSSGYTDEWSRPRHSRSSGLARRHDAQPHPAAARSPRADGVGAVQHHAAAAVDGQPASQGAGRRGLDRGRARKARATSTR